MHTAGAPRSIALLAIGIALALSIVTLAPAPLALLLAFFALPIEAFLIAAAFHGQPRPPRRPSAP